MAQTLAGGLKSIILPSEVISSYRMEHQETKLSNEEILLNRISDLERAGAGEAAQPCLGEDDTDCREEGISILKRWCQTVEALQEFPG